MGLSKGRLPPRYRLLLLGLFALVLYRIVSGFLMPLPLQVDEAQYLGWSYQPSAGYYSKPPFVAWVLGLNRWVCQVAALDGVEGCARALQPVALLVAAVAAGLTSWVLFQSEKAGALTTALLLCSPLFGFYSLFATTDAWLLMWWSVALCFFVLASNETNLFRTLFYWFLCGLALGFGLLTKYSMGVFLISAVVWLVINKRLFSIGPWAALITATLIFLPNLLWNYEHGFPTFTHHVEIAQFGDLAAKKWELSRAIRTLLEFLAAQSMMLGPFVFVGFFVAIFRKNRLTTPIFGEAYRLLCVFALPIFLIICAQAFLSRAHANWASAAYVSIAIFVVGHWFVRPVPKPNNKENWFFYGSLAIGIVCTAFFVHGLKFLYWDPRAPDVRALDNLRGWKEAALALHKIAEEKKMAVVAEDRKLLAALHGYRGSHKVDVYAYDPSQSRNNHYSWFYGANQLARPEGTSVIWALVEKQETANVTGRRLVGIFPVGNHGDAVFAQVVELRETP
jgi:4-amino-4-deoxy-L-arabinose transferase-like glycosyltransferase